MYFVVYNYIFAGVGALTSVQISPCYFESVSLYVLMCVCQLFRFSFCFDVCCQAFRFSFCFEVYYLKYVSLSVFDVCCRPVLFLCVLSSPSFLFLFLMFDVCYQVFCFSSNRKLVRTSFREPKFIIFNYTFCQEIKLTVCQPFYGNPLLNPNGFNKHQIQ